MSEQRDIKDGAEFQEEPPIRNRAIALEITRTLYFCPGVECCSDEEFAEDFSDSMPKVQAILDREFPEKLDGLRRSPA